MQTILEERLTKCFPTFPMTVFVAASNLLIYVVLLFICIVFAFLSLVGWSQGLLFSNQDYWRKYLWHPPSPNIPSRNNMEYCSQKLVTWAYWITASHLEAFQIIQLLTQALRSTWKNGFVLLFHPPRFDQIYAMKKIHLRPSSVPVYSVVFYSYVLIGIFMLYVIPILSCFALYVFYTNRLETVVHTRTAEQIGFALSASSNCRYPCKIIYERRSEQ